MYYLEKVGVYGHGIYWVGDDLEQGKLETNKFANNDIDDYHNWNLYLFNKENPDTSGIVHSARKIKI